MGLDWDAARAADLPPLSHAEATRILEKLSHLPIVLVGGQAISFWSRLLPEAQQSLVDMALTSRDIDFEGSHQAAAECAERLAGDLRRFRPGGSPTIAEVGFVDGDGHPRVIDFLTSPGGVDGREVVETAVPVDIEQEGIVAHLRVMAPLLCLQSRVFNVVSLQRESRLSLDQLRAAIACTRAYSRELLEALPADEGPREVLAINERVASWCIRDADWLTLAIDRPDLDPLEALLVDDDRLPAKFATHRLPQLLRAVDSARERRRGS